MVVVESFRFSTPYNRHTSSNFFTYLYKLESFSFVLICLKRMC